MARIILILLVGVVLIAGCASENSRYKDNVSLERPPEMPIDKQAAEQQAINELEAPVRRHGKGLKSDVYRVESSSREIVLRRTYDEAWSLLNQAIQHNELKINDQDRSKGAYYIAYGGSGMFGLSSLFASKNDQPTYLIKLDPQDQETKVTISLANTHEQSDSGKLKDGAADDAAVDKSENLLDLLFDTLHDTVKDE